MVRRLTHENLLPALERFAVVVSRLRGLARFQDYETSFGLSRKELDNVLDTISCLQLLAHHMLIAASSELRQFVAFSTWLRQEIETQSMQRSGSTTLDGSETDVHIEYMSTLEYIQGAMSHSRLIRLFNIAVAADRDTVWDIRAEGGSLYELYKKELCGLDREIIPKGRLPGLDALLVDLESQCQTIFDGIAETQKRNVRIGSPVYLGRGRIDCVDMRLLAEVCGFIPCGFRMADGMCSRTPTIETI